MASHLVVSQPEKLDGVSNYAAWKFTMKMQLIKDNLWPAVEPGTIDQNKKEVTMDLKAFATISLGLKSHLYMQVSACKTAKEAWEKLVKVYEDRGLLRKLHLRRELSSIKFKDCVNMEDYLNRMMTIAQELSGINAAVNDEELAMQILLNLPDSYDPLVMALENSGQEITSDLVRTKLIQEDCRRMRKDQSESGSTLMVKQQEY